MCTLHFWLQDLASNVAQRDEEAEEDELAAERLGAEGAGGETGHLGSAQRSLLQALQVLSQVQQYAEAAARVHQHQEQPHRGPTTVSPLAEWVSLPLPENVQQLRQELRGQSAAALNEDEGPASKIPRTEKEEQTRRLLQQLCDKPVGVRLPDHGDAAAASSPMNPALEATRRAAGLVRAASLREASRPSSFRE